MSELESKSKALGFLPSEMMQSFGGIRRSDAAISNISPSSNKHPNQSSDNSDYSSDESTSPHVKKSLRKLEKRNEKQLN